MLIIKTNQPNTLVVTVSQNSELPNPEYLFSFTHIFSKASVTFIPTDISTHKSRYDEFYFVEGTAAGQIAFPYQGQYLYSISEQPQGSGNLNPALAYNVVENGEAQVFPSSASTMDSQYDIFISNNEDNSNIIFAPGEINPTPNSTATPTPTPSTTPIVSPTTTPTQTPTTTPTTTPTPSTTPPAFTGLTFIVASASTQGNACSNLLTGTTFNVYAQDLGNCAPCFPDTCWACLTTSQSVYLDQALTILVGDGYYANDIGPSNNTWYIVGGFPQSGGFMAC
jgi:hypothetical protein